MFGKCCIKTDHCDDDGFWKLNKVSKFVFSRLERGNILILLMIKVLWTAESEIQIIVFQNKKNLFSLLPVWLIFKCQFWNYVATYFSKAVFNIGSSTCFKPVAIIIYESSHKQFSSQHAQCHWTCFWWANPGHLVFTWNIPNRQQVKIWRMIPKIWCWDSNSQSWGCSLTTRPQAL